ncbi:MAG: HAMP domain-containing sensor histidine kinase [Sediminibacterium sp.]|nr:HAMP domain-containing sensor histidine kinase [Sediminibacterium sp.]
MANPIKTFFNKILTLGINNEMHFVEIQKSYMFNLFLVIATPLVFFVFLFNLANQQYLPAVVSAIQFSIFCFGFWISYTQKYLYLRSGMLIVLAFIGLLAAYFFKSGNEYRMLIMIIAAVVLFDKIWQYMVFAVMVALIFVFIRMNDMAISTMSATELLVQTIKILLPMLIFILCLFYLKHGYLNYQLKLEKAFQELAAAKEQKERILNAVAHDLRSPISSIAGITKLILMDDNLTAEQIELLQLAEQSSSNTIGLINDLLQTNLKEIHAYKFVKADLNEVLHQSVRLLEFNASDKKIQLQTEMISEHLFALIDPDKIDRVVTNLVNNAIKFSNPNSVINISLSRKQDEAVIAVKDHGIGIPEDKKDKVFDSFTEAKRKGTSGETSFGLGLSICKQIIEVHKGKIQLESKEGSGSSFYVYLPLA